MPQSIANLQSWNSRLSAGVWWREMTSTESFFVFKFAHHPTWHGIIENVAAFVTFPHEPITILPFSDACRVRQSFIPRSSIFRAILFLNGI